MRTSRAYQAWFTMQHLHGAKLSHDHPTEQTIDSAHVQGSSERIWFDSAVLLDRSAAQRHRESGCVPRGTCSLAYEIAAILEHAQRGDDVDRLQGLVLTVSPNTLDGSRVIHLGRRRRTSRPNAANPSNAGGPSVD